MSAQRISLKSKPIVAVVLVLLAIVVAVNASVFGPQAKTGLRANVRVQTSQPMPLDLGDFRSGSSVPEADLAAWGILDAPPLERDPFSNTRAKAPVRKTRKARRKTTAVADLECNAILLGGVLPVALINGERHHVGDRVGKYQVMAIGATGVKLKSDSGSGLFLSVYTGSENAGRGRVVTELTETNGLGRTSLVEHATGERK